MTTPELPKLERFSLHLTVYFKPEDVPKFYEALKPAFDAVIQEKECHYFEVFEDPAEPGKVTWIENWDGSPDWFLNERLPKKMDFMKPYLDATEPLFIKEREFKILKRVGLPYVMQKPENVR